MITNEMVTLVDEHDTPLGLGEKMEVHRAGLLHRAVSVIVFNSKGEMLLQQRAASKYHTPSLWTNTCCTHPLPGESVENAAKRRLHEEMGFKTQLRKAFHFTYKAEFENGMIEHEFDHVFTGKFDGEVFPNTDEASGYRHIAIDQLRQEMQQNPESFTPWFHLIFEKMFLLD